MLESEAMEASVIERDSTPRPVALKAPGDGVLSDELEMFQERYFKPAVDRAMAACDLYLAGQKRKGRLSRPKFRKDVKADGKTNRI